MNLREVYEGQQICLDKNICDESGFEHPSDTVGQLCVLRIGNTASSYDEQEDRS